MFDFYSTGILRKGKWIVHSRTNLVAVHVTATTSLYNFRALHFKARYEK